MRSQNKWRARSEFRRIQTGKADDKYFADTKDSPGTVLLPRNQEATAGYQHHIYSFSDRSFHLRWEHAGDTGALVTTRQSLTCGAMLKESQQQQHPETWQLPAALLGSLNSLTSLRTKMQMSNTRHPVMDLTRGVN